MKQTDCGRRCTHAVTFLAMILAIFLLTGMAQSIASEAGDLLASLRTEDKVVGQLYLGCVRTLPAGWTKAYPRPELMKFTRRGRLYALAAPIDTVLTARKRPAAASACLE